MELFSVCEDLLLGYGGGRPQKLYSIRIQAASDKLITTVFFFLWPLLGYLYKLRLTLIRHMSLFLLLDRQTIDSSSVWMSGFVIYDIRCFVLFFCFEVL